MSEGALAPAADGPIVQSVRIGFRLLQLVTAALAVVWLASNVRPVPPEMQAVVLRFGQVVRVQQSGLVLAWPRPIEQVVLLAGPNRQLDLRIEARTARAPGIAAGQASSEVVPEDAGAFLSGDGGIVLLDTTLTWRIADAREYLLAAAHVARGAAAAVPRQRGRGRGRSPARRRPRGASRALPATPAARRVGRRSEAS